MEGVLNPYIKSVATPREHLFDPSSNYWIRFDSSQFFFNFVERYKDHITEYLFVDCSLCYPSSLDFGFLRAVINKIMTSNHLTGYNFSQDIEKIWIEMKDPEKNEFELSEIIYKFFQKLEFPNKVIVVILSDIHLIEDKIQDKEIFILNKISYATNMLKLWVVSHSKPDFRSSRIRSEFFNAFKQANDIQKDTFFRCARCIDNKRPNKVTMDKIKLFISYAHADERYKNELLKHLAGLRRTGIIDEWNDRYIRPGDIWEQTIKSKLYESHVILFLVSANFLDSKYINDVEIDNAIKRHRRGEAKIIPIIIKPCDFESLSISQHQALPKDAKPISKWRNKDEAWLSVVNSLKGIINLLLGSTAEYTENDINKDSLLNVTQGGTGNINIVNNSGPINISR